MSMQRIARQIGFEVEKKARDYLESQGLVFKESNYLRQLGEIDLIMIDKEVYVFVEVRFREDKKYCSAIESISQSKKTKLIRAAKLYLLENNLYEKVFCRFDVITGRMEEGTMLIEWYKNAFGENFV